jgi:plasmid stabilization system protein ParE
MIRYRLSRQAEEDLDEISTVIHASRDYFGMFAQGQR